MEGASKAGRASGQLEHLPLSKNGNTGQFLTGGRGPFMERFTFGILMAIKGSVGVVVLVVPHLAGVGSVSPERLSQRCWAQEA